MKELSVEVVEKEFRGWLDVVAPQLGLNIEVEVTEFMERLKEVETVLYGWPTADSPKGSIKAPTS